MGARIARGAALHLVTTGATTAQNTRGRAKSSSFSAAIMSRTSLAAWAVPCMDTMSSAGLAG